MTIKKSCVPSLILILILIVGFALMSGCSSVRAPETPPAACPIVNRAPLRITEIPQPIGTGTEQYVADYILQLHAAIRQCNADKTSVVGSAP